MCQAMIISLGGTPEPLARSIAEHRPAFICFFASHDSVERLGQVRCLLAQDALSLPPKHIVLAEDVNDLVHCYEKALECARLLAARDIPPAEVVVDYTGGTKTMTAALALATVGKGYRFSYVGGEKRNKEGLGVVESGFEVVHTGVSPWQIFAVEEWQHLVLYVRQYQYEAALTLVSQTRPRLPVKEQLRWQGLEEALAGLLHWDRFNHREALPLFRQGIEKLSQWLEIKDDRALNGFVAQGRECLNFLKALANQTDQFKRPGPLMVADLLANAERRAVQGRYDDATARLYRALEMQGQIAVQELTGASTGNVPEGKIPASLREEYALRYRDPQDGKIKIPLEATFRLLHALEHPLGQQFVAQQENFRRLLLARNGSILAHGLQPVSPEVYAELRELSLHICALPEPVVFPQLQYPY
jgi:CRISPR-associated protein (TIGR02710 family)